MVDRIAFFLEGKNVPSTRFRVEQYQELLNKDRIEFINFYSWPNKYLYYPNFVKNIALLPLWRAGSLLFMIVVRLVQIVYVAYFCNVAVLQRDLLYRVPFPFLEKLIFWMSKLRKSPLRIVLDVDDAIYLSPKSAVESAWQRKKIAAIAKGCDLVICGNQYLTQFFSVLAETVVIPTTVKVPTEMPKKEFNSAGIVVGWIGTIANLHYLKQIEASLVDLQEKYKFKIVLVTNNGGQSPFSEMVRNVEIVPWKRESEDRLISTFDIGVMPLNDDEWSKGKCGFKLLQYGAAGIPSVASPIGVNQVIIKNGVNGFLANSEAEWREALESLIQNESRRSMMSEGAFRNVNANYNMQDWYLKWKQALLSKSAV